MERGTDVVGQAAQRRGGADRGPGQSVAAEHVHGQQIGRPARLAMRVARRSTVSLSGPPVSATTTRSRFSHTSVMCLSAR